MAAPPKNNAYNPDCIRTYYRGDHLTLRIQEVVAGDQIQIWLKPRHVLELHRTVRGQELLLRYGRARGYSFVSVRGGVLDVDVEGEQIRVVVSPGGFGFPIAAHATASVPFAALSRVEVYKPRFDADGNQGVKFPYIYTVVF